MRFIFFIILLLPLSLFAKQRSGMNAEPYAGYFIGETEGTSLGESDVKSYLAGAKLGYQTEGGWFFGIDYAQGKGKFETDTEKQDLNIKDGGVFIGYNFPVFLKVWATYIILHELEIEDRPTQGDIAEAEGDGFNLGLSMRGIPYVSLSLTYSERTLSEYNNNSVDSDNKVKTTMLSMSLPYNFPWKP